jgi:hypothetical protein
LFILRYRFLRSHHGYVINMTEHAKNEKEIENRSVAFYPLNLEGQNENMENGTEDPIFISRSAENLRLGSVTLRLDLGDTVD